MSLKFEPISDNKAFSEKIVSKIADAVVKGELRPGERMPTERDLAEQFGVSRTVVRDAVKTLAGRGILRVRHGAGIFVATAEDSLPDTLKTLSSMLAAGGPALRDLFEAREALETQTAERAAIRAEGYHLERLKSILDDALEHKEDLGILSERDAQFHVAIAEASQNLVCVRIMLTLLDLLAVSRHETLSIPGRAQRSLEDHAHVIDCIEARDSNGARRAMLDHLRSVESSLANCDDGLEH